MIDKGILKSVVSQFGFKDEQALYNWAQRFTEDWIIDGSSVLYTDGDDGVILIKGYSDIFEWDGATISIVYGNYSEFSFNTMENLMAIIDDATLSEKLEYFEDGGDLEYD